MFTFSNPRRHARIDNWPNGRHTTVCEFFVESHPKRGERVGRTTLDKNGRPCKPKHLTYAKKCAIVDGSDGRTYLLCWSDQYAAVAVFSSDMQHNARVIDGEAYIPGDHPRYAELKALVDAAGAAEPVPA